LENQQELDHVLWAIQFSKNTERYKSLESFTKIIKELEEGLTQKFTLSR